MKSGNARPAGGSPRLLSRPLSHLTLTVACAGLMVFTAPHGTKAADAQDGLMAAPPAGAEGPASGANGRMRAPPPPPQSGAQGQPPPPEGGMDENGRPPPPPQGAQGQTGQGSSGQGQANGCPPPPPPPPPGCDAKAGASADGRPCPPAPPPPPPGCGPGEGSGDENPGDRGHEGELPVGKDALPGTARSSKAL